MRRRTLEVNRTTAACTNRYRGGLIYGGVPPGRLWQRRPPADHALAGRATTRGMHACRLSAGERMTSRRPAGHMASCSALPRAGPHDTVSEDDRAGRRLKESCRLACRERRRRPASERTQPNARPRRSHYPARAPSGRAPGGSLTGRSRDRAGGDDEPFRSGSDVSHGPAGRECERGVDRGEKRRRPSRDEAPPDDGPHHTTTGGNRDDGIAKSDRAQPVEVTVTMRRDDGIPRRPGQGTPGKMSWCRIELLTAHALDHDLIESDLRDAELRHRDANRKRGAINSGCARCPPGCKNGAVGLGRIPGGARRIALQHPPPIRHSDIKQQRGTNRVAHQAQCARPHRARRLRSAPAMIDAMPRTASSGSGLAVAGAGAPFRKRVVLPGVGAAGRACAADDPTGGAGRAGDCAVSAVGGAASACAAESTQAFMPAMVGSAGGAGGSSESTRVTSGGGACARGVCGGMTAAVNWASADAVHAARPIARTTGTQRFTTLLHAQPVRTASGTGCYAPGGGAFRVPDTGAGTRRFSAAGAPRQAGSLSCTCGGELGDAWRDLPGEKSASHAHRQDGTAPPYGVAPVPVSCPACGRRRCGQATNPWRLPHRSYARIAGSTHSDEASARRYASSNSSAFLLSTSSRSPDVGS